jgi:pimeloyl-ACP methyl ester carboxylesterase
MRSQAAMESVATTRPIKHTSKQPELEETREGKHRWLRAAWKGATALGILGGGGVVLHAILAHRERKQLTPPGRMIDVEGHKMHMLATGSGEPTVILETGSAGYYGAWEWVQREIEKHTRVVSYDRAGLGFSDKVAGKRDADSMARELDAMLTAAGERPPYILVGHSFGGLLMMAYAHLYSEKTAGLILVDPSHPDQIERNSELRKWMQNFRRFFHVAAAASHLGIMRVTDMLSSMSEGLPELERMRARSFFVSARHLKSSARELDAWKETTDLARSIHLGSLPVLILSASEPQVDWVRDFQTMHDEMTNISRRAVHRTVPGVEHLNFVTRRENAKVVSDAILDLIEHEM